MAHARQDSPSPPAQHQTPASRDNLPADLHSSHGIEINVPTGSLQQRPLPVKHLSAPAYASPIRHHTRVQSRSREIKETINARTHYGSQDDDEDAGVSVHKVNQYVIKQEIGRGSFGAVHLAVDQYGTEFAVKEFSKSRLRKRAQSNLLRQPDRRRKVGHYGANLGFNSPLHRIKPTDRHAATDPSKPFELIKEEIAIMKKLSHHNVVSLIEVLDDPDEDTLYMVLEMCKKGIVMKVGLDERAEPYTDEVCRTWFRDMILGIEYLHAQGIIHRDIKPDNCLVTEEGVLKIVDFGVSEMFEKSSPMETAKSAGSPAFMPPELCVAKHGVVSGRPADIWSMGATLYCMRYGHIPFEKSGALQLYDSIRLDDFPFDGEQDEQFRNLMLRLLEKDPEKRITMPELRKHPWVTKNGTDPLLSEEENCAELVGPPTESEMNRAITGNMANLMIVMKAVKRFKARVARKRPMMMENMIGRDAQFVTPPNKIQEPRDLVRSRSIDTFDRQPLDQVLATEGVHRVIEANDNLQKLPVDMDHLSVISQSSVDQHARDVFSSTNGRDDGESVRQPRAIVHARSATFPLDDHGKGHAHDPLEDQLYLRIGVGGDDMPTPAELKRASGSHFIVSESPPGIDSPIYEQAYQEELRRILAARGEEAAMFLNRRVEHREDINKLIQRSRDLAKDKMQSIQGSARFGDIVKQAQSHVDIAKQTHNDVSSASQELGSAVKKQAQDHMDTIKQAQDGIGTASQKVGKAVKAGVGAHLNALKDAHAKARNGEAASSS